MNKLTEYITTQLLGGLTATVHLENGEDAVLTPALQSDSGKTVWTAQADGISLTFTAVPESDVGAVFYVDLISSAPLQGRAVTIKLDPSCADRVLANNHDNCPWWMMCSWPKKPEELDHGTQGLLLEKDGLHYATVFLTGDIFRCEGHDYGMIFDSGCDGFTELHGSFLSVFASEKPIEAVEKSYKLAQSTGDIRIPLRAEREYPAIFEKFGWCTWNAFYQDVTSEKLYEKLDEFKQKNVPVKWIIIDDGWPVFEGSQLVEFRADPAKFPEGLAECVRRIKEEYGVEMVGVWHTINGYPGGIRKDSPLAEEYKDSLRLMNSGVLMPSDDPEKGFLFWDAWHGYIAGCGVDFVKVDGQSSAHDYFCKTVSTTVAVRNAHEALERSIDKHFDGRVINCMGMDMLNILARPSSGISRNSDDFYPYRENGFYKHLVQNLYCAIWHSQIYHCDYDMWWSGKGEAVQSGVLRAISGGPVYVSDMVGETELSAILPVCGPNGEIWRLDNAALPTLDILYVDCIKEGRLVKTYNNKGDSIALAVFNVTDREITETVAFNSIPTLEKDREYLAYEYFTKKYTRVRFGTEVSVTVEGDGVLSYSLYPIESDDGGEYVMIGDVARYVGVGDPDKKKAYIEGLL